MLLALAIRHLSLNNRLCEPLLIAHYVGLIVILIHPIFDPARFDL